MQERPWPDVSDGVSWWCPQCKGRKSIRDGSFFSKSKITVQRWLLLLYWWARQYPVTDAMQEAEVHKGMVIDVDQWLREVCSTRLLSSPIILGGANSIVQIDESLFRHKPKVWFHHRYDFTNICFQKCVFFHAAPSWSPSTTTNLGIRHG